MKEFKNVFIVFFMFCSISLAQVTIDFTHVYGPIPTDYYSSSGLTSITNGYWFGNCLESNDPATPVIITFAYPQPYVKITLINLNDPNNENYKAWDGINGTGTQVGETIIFNTVGPVEYTITGIGSNIRSVTINHVNPSGYNDYNYLKFDSELPVELTSFAANVFNSSVQLKWQTATEVNNYGFEIQRLNPPHNPLPGGEEKYPSHNPLPGGEEKGWVKIGFVNGNGNSNSSKDYSFVDKNISSGKYSYRLKQIDNNGAYKYSNVVEVSFMKPTEFALNQNYPNPFNPSTVISFSIPEDSHVMLKLYDMLGREVQTLINENRKAGTHNINFYADNLSNGVYLYKLTAGNYSDIKKMIILK
ncbi:MAG: T9SS type A sorting domain-containing protein [Bacteroidetes bacterium]|nr:T9SS type A sorting domain-containing protein [Bacteroidota bacterium]